MLLRMTTKHHLDRHIKIHVIDRRSRSSLDFTKHPSVDVILKDLKNCSRRFQGLLKAQVDEAQILERLYYKGKNQHRGALFWRRVAEMRRFCIRLDDVQIDVVVDTFYRSFFDEQLGIGSKLPKGAWTHFPDIAFVGFVLARLSACSNLLIKMQSQLMKAYQSFTLALKSGAFLQLALTLAAIASRMETTTSELCNILEETTVVTRKALLIVTSSSVDPPTCVNDMQTLSQIGVAGTTNLDLPCRDTLSPTSVRTEQPNHVESSEYPQLSSRVVVEYKAHRQAVGDIKPGKKKQKRKELKVKDEIDDIFGF